MLTYGNGATLTGSAHIVISMDAGGVQSVTAIYRDAHDSTLCYKGDACMLQADIPMLLDELRQQLYLGRRLTVEESEPFKRKRMAATRVLGQSGASVSMVTE